jgi:UDP-N-acetylmuramate dehydrogenase
MLSSCPSPAEFKSNEVLKPYTSFKIGGAAKLLVDAGTPDQFREALALRRAHNLPLFVLGGGSNVLISDRGFDGLVVHPANRGVSAIDEDRESVTLRVNAAEKWDDVVAFAVEHGWWGIENLSHIPGQAGAALIQNIGAYGHQISDVLLSTEIMEIESGTVISLQTADCEMGYRTSVFNTTRKGQMLVLSLVLRLSQRGEPNLRYPDLKSRFSRPGNASPTLEQIREAVISIRDRKFPFPRGERGGNAGSFFKNLILSSLDYQVLEANLQSHFGPDVRQRLLEIRSRSPAAGPVRIPTAFLIDACGLKGYWIGSAKVNESQPLVLLNEGGATAEDVLRLARHIRQTVYARTGIAISLEPELVGFSQAELADYLALA